MENTSLYVGDLEKSVKEEELHALFNQIAPVVSVIIYRDDTSDSSLGYACVNFNSPIDAAKAKETLNFTPMKDKPIRIMFWHRDPSTLESGRANLFVKNLGDSIDNKALLNTFSAFGTVLSCKVAMDDAARSKGYGFVQFADEKAASAAITKLNGTLLDDKHLYVGAFVRRHQSNFTQPPVFTNIYVKNLPESATDDHLREIFAEFGAITSAVVMKDRSGKSRCFGFVDFETADAAATAVEKMDRKKFDDEKVLYVGRAQRKKERVVELRAKYEQEKKSWYEKMHGLNLYLNNMDESVDDGKIKELFSEFGNITSCKVLVDTEGISKGYGFVAFSTPEEASKALKEMNGKMVGKKPIYVALAQHKDDRKPRLQMQSQLPTLPPPPRVTGGYELSVPPPSRLNLHQQQLCFNPPAPMLPAQHPYRFHQQPQPLPLMQQQQLMRGPIVPNFMMPFLHQSQVYPPPMDFGKGSQPMLQPQQQPWGFL